MELNQDTLIDYTHGLNSNIILFQAWKDSELYSIDDEIINDTDKFGKKAFFAVMFSKGFSGGTPWNACPI